MQPDPKPPALPDETASAGDAIGGLPALMARIEAEMIYLNDLISTYSDDLEGLASARLIAERIGESTKYAMSEVDRHLLAGLGKRKEITLADGRKLQKFSDPKEVWNEPKVNQWLADVITQHSVDLTTGEKLVIPEVAVEVMRNVMAKAKPKKQAMKAHGVNPDDYCTTEWSDPKVRIAAESEVKKALEKTKS